MRRKFSHPIGSFLGLGNKLSRRICTRASWRGGAHERGRAREGVSERGRVHVRERGRVSCERECVRFLF